MGFVFKLTADMFELNALMLSSVVTGHNSLIEDAATAFSRSRIRLLDTSTNSDSSISSSTFRVGARPLFEFPFPVLFGPERAPLGFLSMADRSLTSFRNDFSAFFNDGHAFSLS